MVRGASDRETICGRSIIGAGGYTCDANQVTCNECLGTPRTLWLAQEIHALLVERFGEEMSHATCVTTGEVEIHLKDGFKFTGRVERT